MEERKRYLYKKEMWITIIFSVLTIIMGHTATFFVIFPGMQAGTLWGFPMHYIIPILTGWFGSSIVAYIMMVYCNKFDDELDELKSKGTATGDTSAQSVVQAGTTVEGGK